MQAYFDKDAVFYPYSVQRVGDSYYLVEELRYRLTERVLAAKILKFEQELEAVHA